MDSASYLDSTAEETFFDKTPTKGMEILDCITENCSFLSKSRPFQEKRESSHKAAKSDLPVSTTSDSAVESSPESRVPEKEEIQSLKLPSNSRMIILKMSETPRIIFARGSCRFPLLLQTL